METHDYIADSNKHSFSQTLVRSGHPVRLLAFILLGLLLLFVLILTVVPWMQTVSGKGKITALTPAQRPQFVQSQITGRLVRWTVQEGATVIAGDTIAILQDIDSKFLDLELLVNQEKQLAALYSRRESILEQVSALRKQVFAEEKARESSVKGAREKLEQATQRRISTEERLKQAKLDWEIARQRFNDRKELHDKGLLSQRQFENARLELQRGEVTFNSISADVESARRGESEAMANISNKESEGTSKVLKVMGDESKALETISSIDNSLYKSRSDLNSATSRRDASIVRAPVDGKVVRLFTLGAGETVKQGDKLAVIAPKTTSLAVELLISGTDAPLMRIGQKVRLEFDGFPAVQIAGWPSVAVGTFGGEVTVVDALETDGGKGQFRLVIKPDSFSEPWPSTESLRLGTKCAGWMQLNNVSLGYELWRQLNGFPLSTDKPTDNKKSESSSDNTSEEK